MKKLKLWFTKLLYKIGILVPPMRYCPKCNIVMLISKNEEFDPIAGKMCISYKCPTCGSILHSPVEYLYEDEEDDGELK